MSKPTKEELTALLQTWKLSCEKDCEKECNLEFMEDECKPCFDAICSLIIEHGKLKVQVKAFGDLMVVMKKTVAWLERRIQQSDRQEKQNRGRFDNLADACAIDAKNHRIQLAEAKAAIVKAKNSQEAADE